MGNLPRFHWQQYQQPHLSGRLQFRAFFFQWRQRPTSCHWKRNQLPVTTTRVERWNLVIRLSLCLTRLIIVVASKGHSWLSARGRARCARSCVVIGYPRERKVAIPSPLEITRYISQENFFCPFCQILNRAFYQWHSFFRQTCPFLRVYCRRCTYPRKKKTWPIPGHLGFTVVR